MLYLIYAADAMYGGLHGLYNYEVWDCKDSNEAYLIGEENSYDIISSYSAIYEQLDSDIRDIIDESEHPMSEDDIEELTRDVYKDDLEYEIYKINENLVKEENLTIEDLETIANNDPEYFLEYYCQN